MSNNSHNTNDDNRRNPLHPHTSIASDTPWQNGNPYCTNAIVPPIVQTANFAFPTCDAMADAYDSTNTMGNTMGNTIYGGVSNDTTRLAEQKLAKMMNAPAARLFPSGISAITNTILACVTHGSHIIVVGGAYSNTLKFITEYLPAKLNTEYTIIDGTAIEQFENSIKPNTQLIMLESPTSSTFQVQPIAEVAKLARSRNITTIIDNTLATPLNQQPLNLGIDLEIHSCSKYLNGHSDVILGVVGGNHQLIHNLYSNESRLFAAKVAPFESWLLLRGLKTLPVRLNQQTQNAATIATLLQTYTTNANNNIIREIHYTGLDSHPQRNLIQQQMTGNSAVISFTPRTNDMLKVKAFVDALNLFAIGVSWGSTQSMVFIQSISYSRVLREDVYNDTQLPHNLVRLSIGLENVDDLALDLQQALQHL